jgi:hypothetical protein
MPKTSIYLCIYVCILSNKHLGNIKMTTIYRPMQRSPTLTIYNNHKCLEGANHL